MDDLRLPKAEILSPAMIAAALALGVVGAIDFMLQPLGIGAAVKDLQLSERQVGFFAAFDMFGFTVSAVAAVGWIRRVSWRRAATLNLLLLAASQLLSTQFDTFTALAPARILTGFAGGNLLALTVAFIADSDHPERLTGFLVAGQLAFQTLGFYVLPATAIKTRGLDGLFIVFALFALAALPAASRLPAAGRVRPQLTRGTRIAPAALALLGFFFYYMGYGALWAYVERIGSRAGLEAGFISFALAVSVVVAGGGALVAIWFGRRISRPFAFWSNFLAQFCVVILLMGEVSAASFAVALCMLNFFWNFVLPYQTAALIAADPSGRLVVLQTAAQAAGLALGPSVAALLLAPVGFSAIHLVAVAAGTASLVLFLSVGWRRPQPEN